MRSGLSARYRSILAHPKSSFGNLNLRSGAPARPSAGPASARPASSERRSGRRMFPKARFAGPSVSLARSGIATRWDGRFSLTAAVKPPLLFDHVEFPGPTIPSQPRSEWLVLPIPAVRRR